MRRALLLAMLPLAITATACGDKNGDDDDDDNADDTASEEGGEEGGSSDGVSPYITEADAWCYLHETGDTFYQWTVDVVAADPQGNATIESLYDGGIIVKAGDAELADYALVCDDGHCFGSFKEDDDGVSCANATSYTFSFTVADEDGNVSTAYEVTGREGSSAAGK